MTARRNVVAEREAIHTRDSLDTLARVSFLHHRNRLTQINRAFI